MLAYWVAGVGNALEFSSRFSVFNKSFCFIYTYAFGTFFSSFTGKALLLGTLFSRWITFSDSLTKLSLEEGATISSDDC